LTCANDASVLGRRGLQLARGASAGGRPGGREASANQQRATGAIEPGDRCWITGETAGTRNSLTPSQIRYAAPNHLSAGKSPAVAASNAQTPSMDSVSAVKSPRATPTAMGRAARQPWPRT